MAYQQRAVMMDEGVFGIDDPALMTWFCEGERYPQAPLCDVSC